MYGAILMPTLFFQQVHSWLEEILWEKKGGMDVYRCKGVLSIKNSDQLHTLQVYYVLNPIVFAVGKSFQTGSFSKHRPNFPSFVTSISMHSFWVLNPNEKVELLLGYFLTRTLKNNTENSRRLEYKNIWKYTVIYIIRKVAR